MATIIDSATLTKLENSIVEKTSTIKPEDFVNISVYAPEILVELKYKEHISNWKGFALYPKNAKAYCKKDLANKLIKAECNLKKRGLGLKIFDAYRPLSATRALWDIALKEKKYEYVPPPWIGSDHNRGIAVDITLIDLNTKKEIDMGTEFDHLGIESAMCYKNLPKNIKQNRNELLKEMNNVGLVNYPIEWWHFSIPKSHYQIKDIPLLNFKI